MKKKKFIVRALDGNIYQAEILGDGQIKKWRPLKK
jgi:hypothetical protein